MEKQQSIGVLLLFILLSVWWYINAPSAAELQRQQEIRDSIALIEQPVTDQIPVTSTQIAVVPDSVVKAQNAMQYGNLANATVGKEELFTLENEKIIVTFSNKGGYIKSVQLKEHNRISEDEANNEIKHPLLLLDNPKNTFEYLLPISGRGDISTMDLFFDAKKSNDGIDFTVNTEGGQSFTQSYSLKGNHLLDYNIKATGFNTDANGGLTLKWKNYLNRLEKNVGFEKYYSTVYFKPNDDDSDYCSCRGDDETTLDNEKLDWVSHTNQFFNTSLISKSGALRGKLMSTEMVENDDVTFKIVNSIVSIPVENGRQFDMSLFVGPNDYEELKSLNNGLEEIIPFGRSIFGSINRHVIRPAFEFLSKYIGSKGVVIIVLIFILKMLLYPLMYKMLHSQALMGALKPEIAKLKEKIGDDPQKTQMETMKLYREYGVSPLGGCMPMVIQMPIWYALFRFFPASITFRQEPFLWATDLSSYDVLFNLPWEIPAFGSHVSLFTILWAVTTVLYTYYNTKHMDMTANPMMKYIQYFMPLMFLVFFNNYASGLTCYMFFSNLINIAQTVLTKKFVFKDERLLEELAAKKAKPKKTGGFQSRLEEAMKQQQEIAKQRQNQQQPKKKRKK